MTELLKAAFEAASRLPEVDQDRFAALILDELRDEARWQKAFAQSEELLTKLAEEALEDYQQDRTIPGDW